jgi:hypothetical protein
LCLREKRRDLERTMRFQACDPLGLPAVARGRWCPFQQLLPEGVLRAREERVAWLPCRGQCSLGDMAALWPPLCSVLAPE